MQAVGIVVGQERSCKRSNGQKTPQGADAFSGSLRVCCRAVSERGCVEWLVDLGRRGEHERNVSRNDSFYFEIAFFVAFADLPPALAISGCYRTASRLTRPRPRVRGEDVYCCVLWWLESLELLRAYLPGRSALLGRHAYHMKFKQRLAWQTCLLDGLGFYKGLPWWDCVLSALEEEEHEANMAIFPVIVYLTELHEVVDRHGNKRKDLFKGLLAK